MQKVRDSLTSDSEYILIDSEEPIKNCDLIQIQFAREV